MQKKYESMFGDGEVQLFTVTEVELRLHMEDVIIRQGGIVYPCSLVR